MGWRRKLERREKDGKKQYLEAKDTLEKRNEDKLLVEGGGTGCMKGERVSDLGEGGS